MVAVREPAWASSARMLFLASMAIFVVTIAIGILNGADVVEFDRNQILTHVHSGTIGWITLGVVATAFVLFRSADANLARALVVFVPLYVAAFYTGNFQARAIAGTALLAVVLWLFAWIWRTYMSSDRTTARLAVTLGLSTFTYGAVIGVALQIQFALGANWLSGDSIGAHAGAMVFGYLVLVAMGVIEWRNKDSAGVSRGGAVQVVSLFVGGLVLSVGLLIGQAQALAGVYLVTEVIAVILFVRRVLPAAVRIDWRGASPDRYIGAAAIWVILALALFFYLISQFVAANGDVDAISPNLLVANDHSVFIGVMTNLAFGLLGTWVGIEAKGRVASLITFWGVNAGLAIFIAGLVAESAEVKRLGAPLMGVFLLAALAIYARAALAEWRPGREPRAEVGAAAR
jgi:hypothetical protein